MKVRFTKHFPFGKFTGIALFGTLYLKIDDFDKRQILKYPSIKLTTIEHERIHKRQQQHLLYIFFYIWYVIEWFIRIFVNGKAYRNICFEREAYNNEDDTDKYSVYIKYKSKPIEYYGLAKKETLYISFDKFDNSKVKDVKYLDYRPTRTSGYARTCKWGSWLRYLKK